MNHKALLVPDVLHEVFHHLRPLPQEWLADQVREKYQTLAALTRVCKVFQEPATRALWTTLPTDPKNLQPEQQVILLRLVKVSYQGRMGKERITSWLD